MFDTIFLDRDGTINDDPLGYINSLSDYHFYDYTFEALDILKMHCENENRDFNSITRTLHTNVIIGENSKDLEKKIKKMSLQK